MRKFGQKREKRKYRNTLAKVRTPTEFGRTLGSDGTTRVQ